MDTVKRLPREVQVVLGGAVLYLIVSFLDWQQVSFLGVHVGISEWHGVGVVAGLLVIAVLAWEVVRLLDVKVELGSVAPGLVSVALALLLALFTIVTFLSHDTARHWPAWIGLLLALVIGAAAVGRARTEGVQLPELRGTPGGVESSAPAAGAAEPPPAEPPAGRGQPEA